MTLRLVFDDPRHPDFDLDLWVTEDQLRRDARPASVAIQEARGWLTRTEAILRREAAAPEREPAVARHPEEEDYLPGDEDEDEDEGERPDRDDVYRRPGAGTILDHARAARDASRERTMTMLAAAAAVFVLMHLLISGTPVRDAITARIGEGYRQAFVFASIAALAWLIIAYAQFRGQSGDPVFWTVSPATRHPAIGLVLIAFLFMIPGLLTNGPTRVAGGGQVDKASAITGMTRITRHPFLWGAAIWAFAHLLVNGTLSAILLFGSILVLGLFGPFSIDAKRMRALGDRERAKAQT